MEPMALGSPVSSPTTPPPGSTSPASSPFLPAFLMGETSTGPSSARQQLGFSLGSPTKGGRHVSFSQAQILTPTHSSTPVEPQLTRASSFHACEKTPGSGPPIRGLFDTLGAPIGATSTPQYPTSPSTRGESFSVGPSHEQQTDSANTWVTVFGFPPSAAAFILTQFAQYGTLLDKRLPPKGNWVHLQYQCSLECRKALSCNGRVYGGSVMIGVIPCRDQSILGEVRNKENISLQSPVTPFGTPNRTNTSYTGLGTPRRPLSSARPLGQAYRIAQADTEVTAQPGVPQKSTGVVSKAMEYMFGW